MQATRQHQQPASITTAEEWAPRAMKLVDLLAGSGPWYRCDRRRRSRTLPDSRVRFSAPGRDSRLEAKCVDYNSSHYDRANDPWR
jgi:hypothetical protein